ncbi:unnamed protein product, partial [Phaeothamnion confervicola]
STKVTPLICRLLFCGQLSESTGMSRPASSTRNAKRLPPSSKVNDDPLNLELRFLFRLVDHNGSGTVERGELVELLKKMGTETDAGEIDTWLGSSDNDGDGVLSFEEFCQALTITKGERGKYTKDQMTSACRAFEGTRPVGKLHRGVLFQALSEYGMQEGADFVTAEEAAALAAGMEADEKGMVDYVKIVDSLFIQA